MDLLLKNLRWMDGSSLFQGDLRIKNGLVHEIESALIPNKRERVIDFRNHYLYPGLINAHDHLEMNLYPKMGNPPYQNYTEWGNDIYKPRETPIREIEKIDINDRLLWGGVKNLISGVTTVVHHNPWKRILSSEKFPVKVLKRYAWSHSLSFGKNILKSFPRKPSTPFIIHAAEGVDALAFAEVNTLKSLGMLKSNTVLIHAVALTDSDIEDIVRAHASVVWCPASNLFLFSRTAAIGKLKNISIALGSDSTLTGSPTLLHEVREALRTGLVSAEEIFNQVTAAPAKIFSLSDPAIKIGNRADLLIIPVSRSDYFENLVHSACSDIEMVTVNGSVKLCNESIAKDLALKKTFSKVHGAAKWLNLDVQKLKYRIQKIAGTAVESNPLWSLID